MNTLLIEHLWTTASIWSSLSVLAHRTKPFMVHVTFQQAYWKIVTRDPIGTLQKPKNQDPVPYSGFCMVPLGSRVQVYLGPHKVPGSQFSGFRKVPGPGFSVSHLRICLTFLNNLFFSSNTLFHKTALIGLVD